MIRPPSADKYLPLAGAAFPPGRPALSLILTAAQVGCASSPPAGPPSVVVVTLDTTRADRLGCYGDTLAHTPVIDRLAARGRRYANAYGPVPLTIPTHASLFTGLFPHQHGVRSNGDAALTAQRITLAERLREAGYATGASVAAYATHRIWGLEQGFDAYADPLGPVAQGGPWRIERPANEVVDDALGWLAGRPAGRPFLLWVHLYDAHAPNEPTAPGADAYREQVARMDEEVGRLVAAIGDQPVVWVVLGDHGEALGEHHEATHGLFTYGATQHVPWLVSGPGVAQEVVETPVSTVGLTSTLLPILGLPVPEGVAAAAGPVFAESWEAPARLRLAPHRSLWSGGWHLVLSPRPELYDTHADPGELHDLAAQETGTVARLSAELDALGSQPPATMPAAAPDHDRAALAALGYLSVAADAGSSPALWVNPKDAVPLLDRLAARATITDPEVHLADVDALLLLKPDAPALVRERATLLRQLGRPEEARRALEAAGLGRLPGEELDAYLDALEAREAVPR